MNLERTPVTAFVTDGMRNPLDVKVRALEAQVARLEQEFTPRTRFWTCREELPGCHYWTMWAAVSNTL